MIQEIAPKKFDNAYHAKSPKPDDFVLVFRGHGKPDDKVLCRIEDGKIVFPTCSELGCEKHLLQYLFSIDETCYFLYMPGDLSAGLFISDFFSFSYEPIRSLRRNAPVYTCFAGMTGYHLYVWYRDNVFCGRCGAKTVHDKKERMKRCPHCGNLIFPKIAPAVIIGLIYEDSILISTYADRPYKGRALLAGFCEIGETPEQTVVREVQEEVGLRVKNIRYFDSQPWGFDSNLLLGYYCEVDGGTSITMDETELATARFVKRDKIEEDKNLVSLTATMIDRFRKGLE